MKQPRKYMPFCSLSSPEFSEVAFSPSVLHHLPVSSSLRPIHTHITHYTMLLFCIWCRKETRSKSLSDGGRQTWRCPASSNCGDGCSTPFAPASTCPLTFTPERELQGAGEKALIKNGPCPFSPYALFLSPLYQLLPVNVSFSVVVQLKLRSTL